MLLSASAVLADCNVVWTLYVDNVEYTVLYYLRALKLLYNQTHRNYLSYPFDFNHAVCDSECLRLVHENFMTLVHAQVIYR